MKSTYRIISRKQARKLAASIVEEMDFCEVIKLLNYNTEVFFEPCCAEMRVKISNRFDVNEDTASEVDKLALVARNL